MQKTWVPSLGGEDTLEKEMAPHCSMLAWKIPWTEEPGKLQSMESQRVRGDWVIGSNTLHPCWQSLIPFWKILERRWVMRIRRSKTDGCLENSWAKEPTTQTKRNVNLSRVKCFSCHFHSSSSREVQWSLFYTCKKWDQRGWLAWSQEALGYGSEIWTSALLAWLLLPWES